MTDPILDAWLTVIATDGWASARIDAVAECDGTTTAAVAAALPDRWAALTAFGRALDVSALAEAGVDREASVRDRLFSVLMARFDAALDHRDVARILAAAAPRDPGLAAFMALGVVQSVARLAAAAGVATGGFIGPVRVQALTVLYLAVARVWLTDDTPDLAATMKELDTRLAQAETWARRLPHSLPPLSAGNAPPPLASDAMPLPLRPALPAAALRSADGPSAG
jgi:ubiquinone biosynthesis protein COQ9